MVKASSETVVIEVDSGPAGKCECLHFRPLQKRIRGAFDPRRLDNPGQLLKRWPNGVPGQRVGLDLESGEGFILEPLHDAEHSETRSRIEKLGKSIDSPKQTFSASVPTWAYWMKRAVEAGLAKLVEGQFPDIDEADVQREFISRRSPDAVERLAVAVEKLLAELLKRS